jgi:hypothetical protein
MTSILKRNASSIHIDNTTIYGNANTIKGDNNIIYGNSNSIKGDNNTIYGNSNSVKGDNNTINGNANSIKGDNNEYNGNANNCKGDNNRSNSSPKLIQRANNITTSIQNCHVGGVVNTMTFDNVVGDMVMDNGNMNISNRIIQNVRGNQFISGDITGGNTTIIQTTRSNHVNTSRGIIPVVNKSPLDYLEDFLTDKPQTVYEFKYGEIPIETSEFNR